MNPAFDDPATYRDGLPPEAFTSAAFVKLEEERVWPHSWVCIGASSQIPAAGDLLPFTIGVHGIHVQRTTDGGLVGRFNKAQHGGCHFIPVQCQTGRKTRCAFTSCGFSLDRDMIPGGMDGGDVPEMYQYLGMRPDRLGAVAVRTRGPLLFAAVDVPGELNELPSLPGWARSLGWQTVRANWKLVAQSLGRHPGADLPVRNLVLLRERASSCAVILQPVAPTRTIARIVLLCEEPADDRMEAQWRGTFADHARQAEGRQAAGDADGPPKAPVVAAWQARLIGDLLLARPARDRLPLATVYPVNHRFGFVA